MLTTKLNAASWQLHRGNVRGAFRVLESLIVYVRTARWLGSLSAEEAGQLDGWLGEAADRVAAKQPATDSLWEIPRHPESVDDPPDLVAALDSPERTTVAPGGGHDIHSPVVVDGKVALRGVEWIQIYPHGGGLPETTPGVQLALEEVAREGESTTKVSFKIMASGFPTDKTYQLFSYSLSQYNEGLKPVSLGEFPPEALPRMAIQKYTEGEWLQVALISSDLTIAAFAEAIPFPIEAKSGSCRIWLKLISSVGIQFTVHGEGYEAGEPVTAVWHIEEAAIKETWEADSAGSFQKALMHGLRVTEGGLATFSAIGESCDLLLEYEWGQRAMM